MRRLLVTLLLAHVAGSYGLAIGLSMHWGVPRAEIGLLIPVRSPRLMWALTPSFVRFKMTRVITTAYAGYGVGFTAVVVLRTLGRRRSRRNRRRRQGLCTECGYDLT